MGGGAVAVAARNLKKIMADALSGDLGCEAGEVVFQDDCLVSPSGARISWERAVKMLHGKCVYPYAFGSFRAPEVSWDEKTGQGDAYFTYVYSCQAVELEVDRKTGAVKLLNIVAAHDIGKAINRAMILGQMYGGIAQATGQALMEDLGLSEGHIRNLNFNSYRIPKARDMPEMTGIIVENHDPNSPTGAKGIGEPALELMTAAIANAICNATGIRYASLPIKIDPEEFA
jgi:CO/xanthine dehydrogenase Mo-binding subunit